MPVISANGIEIAYDDRGCRDDPAILLIMGLATQMIAWPEPFCDSLAARGFRVVRFDNRDVGLSTKFEAAPPIDLGAILQQVMAGEKINPPYDLTDMTADTVGLMDRLEIDKAHVVGASMGGMIAQIVAAKYPNRVRSLVSIMLSSGAPGLPQAKPEAMTAIMQTRPDGSDRELAIQHGMGVYRAIGSPGFPTPDNELRAKVGAAFDRSYYPAGTGRQFAAIVASGSRVEMLKKLSFPTLVLHGADDPLVPVESSRHTAAQIPGSTLTIVPESGGFAVYIKMHHAGIDGGAGMAALPIIFATTPDPEPMQLPSPITRDSRPPELFELIRDSYDKFFTQQREFYQSWPYRQSDRESGTTR